MESIAAIVITKDEERNIAACLECLKWVDEMIVVDAESSDRTVELAKAYTPKVFVRVWPGYGPQKNFAMTHATTDWILIVDADERVSNELRGEIEAVLKESGPAVAYRIPRRNFYYGTWIRGAGQYPDRQLRLVRRGQGRYNDLPIHEHLQVEGLIGDLQGHLDHHSYPTVLAHELKVGRYSTLSAQERTNAGHAEVSPLNLLLNPLWAFTKIYVLRGGYRNGMHGFLFSAFSAAHVLFKYAKLWERVHVPGSALSNLEKTVC
jgi:glycosyltransferase involved in cell wall biosynthesis